MTFFKYKGFYIDTFDMADVDACQDYFNEQFCEVVVNNENRDDEILLDEAWANWIDMCIEDGRVSREVGESIERV